jgi:SAM-dependent methyltransferase
MSNNLPPNVTISFGPARNTEGPPKPRILFEGCPLCKSSDTALLRKADCSHHLLYRPIIAPSITWMRCNNCSHVFTDGYFPPEVAAVIFEKTHDNQMPGFDFERQRYISGRMVASVAKYITGGSWLDVGFGNGSLLFTAEEWGFTPTGIDLRPSSVEAMQRIGIDASCLDLTAVEGESRFSVISMADVLEHMPFPRDGLAAARRLLLAEGILLVSMPNYNCAAWRLLDAINANPYWGELEHFHNFSRSRLYTLTKDMGFEVVQYGISERYRVCMEVILRRAT